jgi:hypothetical protein
VNPLRRALSTEKAVAPVATTGETAFPQVDAPSACYRYGFGSGSAPVAATFVSGSALPVSATATASCYRSATASQTSLVAAEPVSDLRSSAVATGATAFARHTAAHR